MPLSEAGAARSSFAHVDDELRQEERVAVRRGDEHFRRAIVHLGQRAAKLFDFRYRETAQPDALRAACRA